MSKRLLALIGLTALVVFAVTVGSVSIPLTDFLTTISKIIQQQPLSTQTERIIYFIRIPRVLLALIVGMSLSLSGLIMQAILNNPLADGSTLGVSSGASLGAVLAVVGQWSFNNATILSAIVGAFVTLLILLTLSYIFDRSFNQITLILTGIILSMFLSSFYTLVLWLSRDQASQIMFWHLGSFSGANYTSVIWMTVVLVISALIIWLYRDELNILSLGVDVSENVGVNVVKTRFILLVVSSTLVGVSVSLAGNIAFVGLIVPHLVKLTLGANHQKSIPVTLFVGGALMIVIDLIARSVFAPIELPIGLITSLLGAVVFLIIVFRERRST